MRLMVMAVVLLGCTGDPGPEGPPGDPGPGDPTPPSINGISPREGFLARTVDVVISGDDTSFDASTTVDFGADITVQQVTLVSPTQLAARIELAETATLGTRDVRVSTGDLVAMMGFEVKPSANVAIEGDGGPLYQGDVVGFYARGLDGEILSVGAEALPADGLHVQSSAVFVDVNAPPGPRQLIWRDVDYYFPKTYASDSQTFAVVSRAPLPLALPSTTLITFDTRSKLYSISTSTLGIVVLARGNVGSAANFSCALLPGSGVFDPLDTAFFSAKFKLSAITPAGTSTVYAVLGAGSTGTDAAHSAELVTSHTPVGAITAETASPHPASSAQAVSAPAIIDATYVANEFDAYSVTVPSGMRLEVTHDATAPIDHGVYTESNYLGDCGSPSPKCSSDFGNSGATATFKVVVYSNNAATYKLALRVY